MKMNKLIASLLAVSLLAFPVVQVSADENISLTVNGEKVETQVPPTIIDGRTMVPVRDIFEACGAKGRKYKNYYWRKGQHNCCYAD